MYKSNTDLSAFRAVSNGVSLSTCVAHRDILSVRDCGGGVGGGGGHKEEGEKTQFDNEENIFKRRIHLDNECCEKHPQKVIHR